MKHQLEDYQINENNILIYCDNTTVICLSKNPILHQEQSILRLNTILLETMFRKVYWISSLLILNFNGLIYLLNLLERRGWPEPRKEAWWEPPPTKQRTTHQLTIHYGFWRIGLIPWSEFLRVVCSKELSILAIIQGAGCTWILLLCWRSIHLPYLHSNCV